MQKSPRTVLLYSQQMTPAPRSQLEISRLLYICKHAESLIVCVSCRPLETSDGF